MQFGIQFLMIIRVKFETHLMSYCGETVEHFLASSTKTYIANIVSQWHVNVMNRNCKLMKDSALFPAGYPLSSLMGFSIIVLLSGKSTRQLSCFRAFFREVTQ